MNEHRIRSTLQASSHFFGVAEVTFDNVRAHTLFRNRFVSSLQYRLLILSRPALSFLALQRSTCIPPSISTRTTDSDPFQPDPCPLITTPQPSTPVSNMALQQYLRSFSAPLSDEQPGPLIRLLALRNSTAKGLFNSVGHVSVRHLERKHMSIKLTHRTPSCPTRREEC